MREQNERAKHAHKIFCDYETKKAKSLRIISVNKQNSKITGIKTHNMSKAMLAQELASLF